MQIDLFELESVKEDDTAVYNRCVCCGLHHPRGLNPIGVYQAFMAEDKTPDGFLWGCCTVACAKLLYLWLSSFSIAIPGKPYLIAYE